MRGKEKRKKGGSEEEGEGKNCSTQARRSANFARDRRDRVHEPREPFHELFTSANTARPAFPWKLIRVYRETISGDSNSCGNRNDLIFHHPFIPLSFSFSTSPPILSVFPSTLCLPVSLRSSSFHRGNRSDPAR